MAFSSSSGLDPFNDRHASSMVTNFEVALGVTDENPAASNDTQPCSWQLCRSPARGTANCRACQEPVTHFCCGL